MTTGPDAGAPIAAQDWTAWEKWTDTERLFEVEDRRPEDGWGAAARRGADDFWDEQEEWRRAALPRERAFWNEPHDREEADGWDDADARNKAEAYEKAEEWNGAAADVGVGVPRERRSLINALTLSEAEALGGPRIPSEWEIWARLEPFDPLIEPFDEDERMFAAPKRRRGSRKFKRRGKRKGRRRNGGSGR